MAESFYEHLDSVIIPYDSFTAARNGDVAYFAKLPLGSEAFAAANKSGWSPIMYASSQGHALLVNYLIMCGVKTNCRSRSMVTPLMLAIASGDMTTVENVFKMEDSECRDYRMWTPLFHAVNFLHERCVEFLLGQGVNVNVVDYQNETPLCLAIRLGHENIVKMLLKTAENLDVVSFKNESAIMLARHCRNKAITEMVLNRDRVLRGSLEETTTTPPPPPPRDRLLPSPKNVTPSPKRFLSAGRKLLISPSLKLSKSFTYSSNKRHSPGLGSSAGGSPLPTPESNAGKTPLWKMCIQKQSNPSTYCDVKSLLESLGLEKYWPVFRDEEVDYDTLLTFSEENLVELGIALYGPRKKILCRIEELRMQARMERR